MARKLKVFVTPAGFHDAYVAAPSRKAALAAWGSDADLFARGIAVEVTDPELTKAPLARPGEVVKRSRGTAAEQLAAAPSPRPRKKAAVKAVAPKKAAPRPDRAALDAAEAALEDMTRRHRAAQRDLAKRQADLDREKREVGRAQDEEAEEVRSAAEKAQTAYDAALKGWRG
ncbi:hypothetical protein ASG29_11080 [Sphingomonas sp. Leaf412]|uniref:hypothetical protein n=1 Tax=Sphingomonas sp. Leaf412 TaxID=1736370 RepID=UPI0006FD468D|nr:hypothetical protein [Sphingomonas sp. Leaf412]KQT32338.1 hypothetical protein ASG29_11080 [Sphingomonas sp. Leaf412]